MRYLLSLRNTHLALTICLAVGASCLTAHNAAWGQASGMGGMGETQTIRARAEVKAIDLTKRQVTLVGPQGNVFQVHVGDAVRNLDKVKVGDTVVATYYGSVVLVLSAPGSTIPDDQATIAGARAPKGHTPAGGAAIKVVVTGTVVGVDLGAHTISLVEPSGGLVHTFTVRDPKRQAALKRVKVGNSLTAIGTEAVAVALDPV